MFEVQIKGSIQAAEIPQRRPGTWCGCKGFIHVVLWEGNCKQRGFCKYGSLPRCLRRNIELPAIIITKHRSSFLKHLMGAFPFCLGNQFKLRYWILRKHICEREWRIQCMWQDLNTVLPGCICIDEHMSIAYHQKGKIRLFLFCQDNYYNAS